MPSLARFEQLRAFGREIDEAAVRKAASTSLGKNVFLSHSSRDKDLLPGVISLLTRHGARVYVDDADARLPENPSARTAEILRQTIDACARFVVFVTPNSKDSKWIPWELGLADGYKRPRHVAVFPATGGWEEAWASREYLGLYQRVVQDEAYGVGQIRWLVLDLDTQARVSLEDWIGS